MKYFSTDNKLQENDCNKECNMISKGTVRKGTVKAYNLTLSLPRVLKIKIQNESQISFCKGRKYRFFWMVTQWDFVHRIKS